MLCISTAYAISRCLSVCLSVHSYVSGLGSHTILVLRYQTSWQYSCRDPPNGGVECRWGRQKPRFLTNIWLSIDDWWSANNSCNHPPCSLLHRPPCICESLFITTSMDDHDDRTEFICMQR